MTVDGVGERVAKVELARVHDAAADVHLDVDVHGASLVPAGIDRAEEGEALRVRALDAAHERPARRTRAETGVDAFSVRMPDVDGGVPDRPARRRVDHEGTEEQRRAWTALRDVATELLAGDVVRALGLLGGEDARDRRGARGPGLEPGEPERRHGGAAEPGSPGERPLKHPGSLPSSALSRRRGSSSLRSPRAPPSIAAHGSPSRTLLWHTRPPSPAP